MAKQKRRGRPPGSKNKAKMNKSVASMDVAQLHAYIESLQKTLAGRIQQQRQTLERQLNGLGAYGGGNGQGRRNPVAKKGRAGTRRKPDPKYQSKANPKLKW